MQKPLLRFPRARPRWNGVGGAAVVADVNVLEDDAVVARSSLSATVWSQSVVDDATSNIVLETSTLVPQIAALTIAPKHGRCPVDDAGTSNDRGWISPLRPLGKAAMVAQDGDVFLVAWSKSTRGRILVWVADPLPEAAAVGPRVVQACVGDGGLAESS